MASNLIDRARQLRRDPTPAESVLWARLRLEQLCGIKFRRQQPIGPYIVDFYCSPYRMVIELDGETHSGREERDEIRQQWLEEQGLTVLRFWDSDIYDNLEGVLETIAKHCGIDT